MSLTATDLQQIKDIVQGVVFVAVHEAVPEAVEVSIRPLKGEIMALRNDVKELYKMMSGFDKHRRRINRRMDRAELNIKSLKATL